MESIVKGNKIMEEALEEMKNYSSEEYVQDYHIQEVFKRSQHNSEINEKVKEKEEQMKSEIEELEQIHKKKETETQEKVIKNMVLKGINDADILEIMNISNKELKKIKLNMKGA